MPGRRPIGGTVFMVVWMVFWTAAIIFAVYALGAEVLEGQFAAAVFLAIWVGAAVFALTKAARTLLTLVQRPAGPPRRTGPNHRWNDDVPDPDRTADRPIDPRRQAEPPPPPPALDAAVPDWSDMPRVRGPRPSDSDPPT